MKLDDLRIKRVRSYKRGDPDTYEGTVDYVGESGAIKLKLDERHLIAILGVVGDALVAQSKDVALNLSTEALNIGLLAAPAETRQPSKENENET